MRQQHLHWPPKAGEIWVAVSQWDKQGGPPVRPGTPVLVLKESMFDNYSTHNLTVMVHGTTRIIVAGPKDLNPLEWHTATDAV